MKMRLFIKTLGLVLLLTSCYLTALAQQPRKKVSLSNEDFPAAKEAAKEPARESSDSGPAESSSAGSGGQVRGLDLQFRILDLRLQAAQETDNKGTREEIIRLKAQLKDAAPKPASKEDLRDLQFRERYVDLKVEIAKAEQDARDAGADIQIERRKVIKGKGRSDGEHGLAGVHEAERASKTADNKVEELKAKLEALLEEGRQAGVGPRAFR